MVYAEGGTCVVELADLSREVRGGEDVGGGRGVGCCGGRGGGGLFRHFPLFFTTSTVIGKGEKGKGESSFFFSKTQVQRLLGCEE